MNDAPHPAAGDAPNAPYPWKPLGTYDIVALTVITLLAAALVLPKVAWIPCLDDPGEFQVCAAIGGIGHPPGHAGLVTLMRGLVLISPLAPHVTVSGATALFAIAAVSILMLIMLRLGVDPVAASVVTLLFLLDDQFWHAATVPEVYATCLIFLAVAVLAFFSWLGDHRFWKLCLAIAAFSYVASNRAPTALFIIAFIAAVLINPRARRVVGQLPLPRVLLLVAIALTPPAIVLISLWLRDVPGNPYNYLDLVYPILPQFPPNNLSAADKLQRLWWLVSAKQFDYMFHPSARTLRGQSVWLLSEFGRRYWMFTWPAMIAALALVIVGARAIWTRHPPIAAFLVLAIPAAAAPILLIRVISHTAMLPSLLFPLAILFAAGLSTLMQWHRSTYWSAATLGAIFLTTWFTRDRALPSERDRYDAAPFVNSLNLPALPSDAVLLTSFDALAIIYAQQYLNLRPDIQVLHYHGRLTPEWVRSATRPVFSTVEPPAGLTAKPFPFDTDARSPSSLVFRIDISSDLLP